MKIHFHCVCQFGKSDLVIMDLTCFNPEKDHFDLTKTYKIKAVYRLYFFNTNTDT